VTLVLLVTYPAFFAQSFSLIAESVTKEHTFDAETVGFVSAAYLLASGIVQIPAGIAFDRLRPGRILAFATLVCAVGAFLIGISQTIEMVTAGRILMGVGSALIFLGSLKLLSLVSTKESYTLTTGAWQMSYRILVSLLVAVFAGLSLDANWRHMMMVFAVAGLGLSILAWAADAFIPAGASRTKRSESLWISLQTALGNRDVLTAGIFFGLTIGPMLSYAYLWAIPSLQTWGDSELKSVLIGGTIPIGYGFGAIVLGMAIERWGRPRALAAIFVAIGLASMTTMLIPVPMPQWFVYSLAFLIGWGASSSMMALSHARMFVPDSHVGTAIAVVTTMGYLFGTALQSGSGLLLEMLSSDGLSYTDYNEGLSPLIQCFLLSLLMLAIMRPWPVEDAKSE